MKTKQLIRFRELNEEEQDNFKKKIDDFGRDARSIMRTLENIKDPEQIENAIKEEVDKIKVLNK